MSKYVRCQCRTYRYEFDGLGLPLRYLQCNTLVCDGTMDGEDLLCASCRTAHHSPALPVEVTDAARTPT